MKFIKNTEYSYIWGKNSAVKWLAVLVFEILIAGFAVISPLSSLIFIATGVVLLILLVKPEYSLYALAFLIIPGTSLIFTMGEITLNITFFFIILALFSWSIARLSKTRPRFSGNGFNQPLLILWAWALLSLLWSHNQIVGLEDTLKLSSAVALVFLITAFINEPKTLRITLGIFIFMGVINAILAFSSSYTNFFLYEKWTFLESLDVTLRFWMKNRGRAVGGRGMGFFTPHGTAVTLSFAITFCMMFFLVTQNIKKRILLGIALILFASTIGTLTKSIIISILAGTSYVVLHLKPFRQRFFTISFVICVLAIVSFALTRKDIGKSAEYVREGLKVESEKLKTTSMGGRIEMSRIGLQKLWETGGLGTGIGGFLQYTSSSNMDGSHPSVLWDLGLVGIVVWIWLLMWSYRLFVMAIRNSNNEYYRRMLIVYMGGYVNVLIAWFVAFAYADIYLWFYLGIGFALVHLSQKETSDRDLRLPFSDNGGSIVII